MINGIPDDHDYLVKIPISYPVDFNNMGDRYNTYYQIKYWVDEITEWQETYTIKVIKGHIFIWFKIPEHATMCALRWL